MGDAEHKEDVLMLTKNLFSQAGSMLTLTLTLTITLTITLTLNRPAPY